MGASYERAECAGSAAAPPGLVGIQDTDDPCSWERVSQPWEVLATPIGPGPFRNHKTFLATPNCILYRESFASRVRVRVLSPEGMLACAIAVTPGSYTTYCGRPLHERGVPASLPGAAEAVLDAGQMHIMVLLRLSLLRRLLSAEQMATIEAAARSHLLPASPIAVGRLGQWLDGILARTHQSPALLRHPAAVDAIERELVVGLMGQVHLSDRREQPAPRAFRQRGFDRAIDCIRYADLTILDNASLCAEAGVSRRTLEYAFRENLGLSPTDLHPATALACPASLAVGEQLGRIDGHRGRLSPRVYTARAPGVRLSLRLRRIAVGDPGPLLRRRCPALLARFDLRHRSAAKGPLTRGSAMPSS